MNRDECYTVTRSCVFTLVHSYANNGGIYNATANTIVSNTNAASTNTNTTGQRRYNV